ncbi:MAG: hypothetical protein JG777_2640 [Clostridia bacterium]|jgi:hypothetical protein|nr:hypothetical protein [Clostridia bacterium]
MNDTKIRIDGDIISFISKEKENLNIKIIFNNKEFYFDEIKTLYLKNNICGEYYEFLPSVYYKETKKWNDSVYRKWEHKIKSTESKKLAYAILYAVSLSLFENQKVEYLIVVRNKRDKICIVQQDNKEENIIYCSIGVKGQYKIISESSTNDYDTVEEYKYVDTSKIIYPDTLGSGAGKCAIWDIFETLGLMSTFNPQYEIMSTREMFECSSTNKGLLDVCENYSRCRGLLDKFRNGTYEIDSSKNVYYYDDIELEEYKGYFIPCEGKHRVCIAKRFGIPQIYAKVFREVNISHQNENNNCLPNLNWNNNCNTEEVLSDCYDRFGKLGLNKEQVKHILESGMSNTELIAYIESVTGKQLKEIAEQIKKKCKFF